MLNPGETTREPPPRAYFVTTRWTVVLAAGRAGDTTGARTALGEMCHAYWYPLYAYVRRRGHNSHDAEDLVQGFFTRLIRLNSVSDLNREKGRFRAFLLASLKHYLSDERRRGEAERRDVRRTVSWDALEAESRYAAEPSDRLSPDRFYERQWALALLGCVTRRLSEEYEQTGRGGLFRELRFAVTGEPGPASYADLSARLGQPEGALRVVAHRLRRRYREILRQEIAHTVERADDIDSELADLRRVLTEPE